MKKNFLRFSKANGNYYSIALKFKNLLQRVDNLIKTGSFYKDNIKHQTHLLTKLQRLFTRLSAFNPSYALKLASATTCLALLTSVATATIPTFSQWTTGNSPFEFSTINGSESFSVLDGAFADIDGDGDDDAALLILDDEYLYDIIYFENVEGVYTENSEDNPFANVDTQSGDYRSIDIADFDKDDDLDLIVVDNASGSYIDHYQLGSEQFDLVSSSDINTNVSDDIYDLSDTFIKFMDVDGDDDLDIIGTSATDNDYTEIYVLYQSDEHVFSSRADSIPLGDELEYEESFAKLAVADMDDDGDDDLFIFSTSGDFCTYYQNGGDFSFAKNTEIPLPTYSMSSDGIVLLSDLDADGDIDVFQPGDYDDFNQAAFENGTSVPTVLEDVYEGRVSIYPNPATTTIHIKGSTSIVALYNLAGRQMLSQDLEQSNRINISALPNGIYMLNVDGEVMKVVKK